MNNLGMWDIRTIFTEDFLEQVHKRRHAQMKKCVKLDLIIDIAEEKDFLINTWESDKKHFLGTLFGVKIYSDRIIDFSDSKIKFMGEK